MKLTSAINMHNVPFEIGDEVLVPIENNITRYQRTFIQDLNYQETGGDTIATTDVGNYSIHIILPCSTAVLFPKSDV